MKKTIFTLFAVMFVCFVSLLITTNTTQAQETTADSLMQRLDQVSLEDLMNMAVVTASKLEQDAGSAPATMVVISEEEIKMRGYQSILDVMYDLPGYNVYDICTAEYRNQVTVRGLFGKVNFIILLDGIKISSTTGEKNGIYENYPVHFAKQIEVVYGPASALYGADAVAGVINIISKEAKHDNLNLEAQLVGGMHGYMHGTLWTSKKFGDNASLTIAANYMSDKMNDYEDLYKDDEQWDTEGYETGTFNSMLGPITPTEKFDSEITTPYKAYSIFAKLKVQDFSFSVFTNMDKNSSAVSYTPNNVIYNDDVFFQNRVTSIAASHIKEFGDITLSSQLSGSRYEIDPESNFRNVYVNLDYGYKYAFSTGFKAEEQLTWNISEKINLITGISYERFISQPKSSDLDKPVDTDGHMYGVMLGTVTEYTPDGIYDDLFLLTYNNTAAYAQLLISPSEKFNLTLGARYDNNSRYGNTFNPRLGMVLKPTSKTTIKALYGSAFLAPTPYTSYAHLGSFYTTDNGQTWASYYMSLPNPDLDPMKASTAEVNIKQYLGDNFSVSLVGYYSKYTDLFSWGSDAENGNRYNGMYKGWPVSYIDVSLNLGSQTNIGGVMQFDHVYNASNSRIKSYLSVSLNQGTVEENIGGETKDVEVSNNIPFTVRLGSDMTFGKFTVSPRLIINGEQTSLYYQEDDPEKRRRLDGYTLLNLGLQYSPTSKITIFANINNALNQEYRVYLASDGSTPEFKDGQAQHKLRAFGGLRITL